MENVESIDWTTEDTLYAAIFILVSLGVMVLLAYVLGYIISFITVNSGPDSSSGSRFMDYGD